MILSVWAFFFLKASDLFIFILAFFFFFFFFFCLFRATPMAYGSFQARGLIAAAAGLHHSHSYVGSEPYLQPTPQLVEMLDP